MIDAMWIWGAIGLVLLAMEMASGTFYIFWFGVSALCVAVAMAMFPGIPHSIQFAMFAALSISSLAIWKLHYKKADSSSRIGQAQGEEIGRVGIVIEACDKEKVGKIQFTQGLMGSREWPAVSDHPIASGAHAKVVAVEGNSLRIHSV
ncbi:MAG TPA: NfeD family protein [Methylophilus sp.]|nr:NfeD family protein [Methylophilus sp.]HQQ33202.1 NfeD family protein [Methylophilus sp.]